MKNILLIRRYAKAFLEYAIQNDMVDESLADLELLTETIQSNRELRNILSQPFIQKSKKENIIKKVFKDKISDKTLNFIDLILEKNHPELLTDLLIMYRDMYNDHKGIAVVTITSVVKLDEERQQHLISFIKHEINGKIQIINKIDKNIIGGFVINYKDYQYDASIYTKLRNLEALFTGNLYVKGY
ncbi:MAG: ATP synthase F1 subunit delta [Bacteroidales bacterium]|nr:ATP synthase F1 subunit delta [Bacteroidales bacterium]